MADTSARDDLLARLDRLDVQARAAFGGWLRYLEGRYFGDSALLAKWARARGAGEALALD